MVDVSVLILAKNEERNIADCIKSCNFAKEIMCAIFESSSKE